MELRGTQYLLDIANRNVKGQQDTYDLTVQLSEAGTSNSLDVLRASAQLENTRATIPPLKARLEALKNSLSVLIGEKPGNLETEVVNQQPLPSLPNSVALGDLNELLRRRPDVRRAEARLQIQISQYNLSVAELYPKLGEVFYDGTKITPLTYTGADSESYPILNHYKPLLSLSKLNFLEGYPR